MPTRSAASSGQTRLPYAADIDLTDKTSDPGDVAGAMFRQHNQIGAAMELYKDLSAPQVPGFNPYRFYQENEASYADIDWFIRDGRFDNVGSQEQFEIRAANIRQEAQDAKTIANGGVFGTALGIGAVLIDPTNLIPFVGIAGKMSAATRVARFSANAMLSSAGQEALLHGMKETRSPYDSLMDIGLSGVLGAGVGGFVHALTPASVLHPTHPDNPLRITNPSPGETVLSGRGSLSAAAVSDRGVQISDSASLGPVDRIGYWLRTPTAVATRIRSDEARAIMQDTAELGFVTKANEAGIPTAASAEVNFETTYLPKLQGVLEAINDGYVSLNKARGSSGIATGIKRELEAVTGGRVSAPVSERTWNDALFWKLNDPAYKHPDAEIDAQLAKTAPVVRKYLDDMGDRLVKAGKLTEQQKIDGYLTQRWIGDRIASDPSRWEAILLKQYSREPDGDWLKEAHGLTPEQFRALPDTAEAGKPSKAGILSDWSTEYDAIQLRQLERSEQAALSDLTEARYQFAAQSRAYRSLSRDVTKLELREAAAQAKAAEAERLALATERETAKAERDAIQRSIDAGIANENARAGQFLKLPTKDTGETELARFEKALKGGDSDVAISKSIEAEQAAKVAPLEAPKAPAVDPTFDTVRANTRLVEANKRLSVLDYQLEVATNRASRLSERLEAIQSKLGEYHSLREAAIAKKREIAGKIKVTEKSLAGTQRKLAATEARSSLPDRLTEIRRAIQDSQRGNAGFLLDTLPESGRVQRRGIHLTPASLAEMVEAGFLETDVNRLLLGYTRDVGSRLSLIEKFGNDTMAEQIGKVRSQYEGWITEASAKGDTAEVKRLKAEGDVAVSTIELLRDRVLGKAQVPSDPSSALLYMGRVMRLANYLRLMGRVLVSALTDTATISLNHGVGRQLQTAIGKPVAQFAKGMKDREIAAITFSAENGLLFSRAFKNESVDDLVLRRGFGDGMTRKVTAAIEGGLKWGSERMSLLNGMAWWNSRQKFVTGQVMMQNILADAETLASKGRLADHRVTEYARFGFSLGDLRDVGKLIAKHGERNEHGLIDPNGGAWLSDTDGEALYGKLKVLLKRATDEAVVTVTAGDLPAFMSTEAGKLLMQFQSFGFAAVNKFARNLRYKAVNGQAWDALLSTTWALTMGAAAYGLSERIVKGKELSDKPEVWVREAIDRSGLMLFMSPALNSGFKLASPMLSQFGFSQADLPSRYRQASWLATLLGPSFSLFEDVQGAGTAIFNGDPDKASEKMKRLAPFNNLFWLDMVWKAANKD